MAFPKAPSCAKDIAHMAWNLKDYDELVVTGDEWYDDKISYMDVAEEIWKNMPLNPMTFEDIVEDAVHHECYGSRDTILTRREQKLLQNHNYLSWDINSEYAVRYTKKYLGPVPRQTGRDGTMYDPGDHRSFREILKAVIGDVDKLTQFNQDFARVQLEVIEKYNEKLKECAAIKDRIRIHTKESLETGPFKGHIFYSLSIEDHSTAGSMLGCHNLCPRITFRNYGRDG